MVLLICSISFVQVLGQKWEIVSWIFVELQHFIHYVSSFQPSKLIQQSSEAVVVIHV